MNDENRSHQDGVSAFVEHLGRLSKADDRAALAALRANLKQPTGIAMEACPLIVPYLGKDSNPVRERAFFLVGALFALHPDTGCPDASLGHAFRAMNTAQEGAQGSDNESLRRRFVALLDSDAEELPAHLRQTVSLLKARNQSLGWERLLRDVLAWDHPRRWVQRGLAKDFWGFAANSHNAEGGQS